MPFGVDSEIDIVSDQSFKDGEEKRVKIAMQIAQIEKLLKVKSEFENRIISLMNEAYPETVMNEESLVKGGTSRFDKRVKFIIQIKI